MTRATYRRARETLSTPSPRVLAAIEAGNQADAAARRAVRAEIAAGADAWALYRAETDRPRRVALLGYLRRGMTALEG